MCLVLTAVVSYVQRDINVFGIDSSCFILTTRFVGYWSMKKTHQYENVPEMN
jgi:hypothetical protein